MLTYELKREKGLPLYESLYRCIRDDILTGNLRAGERLPSKRAFASQLGISAVTVESAYAQLMVEGYIASRPRSGFYVSDMRREDTNGIEYVSRDTDRAKGRNADRNAERNADTGYEQQAYISEREASGLLEYDRGEADIFDPAPSEKKREWIADLSGSQGDESSFPFSIWARLSRQVLTERKRDLLTSPGLFGALELREAICGHLRQFRGIEASPSQIVIGAGAEYLYGLIVQLLGSEKVYGCENPGYRKVYDIFRLHNVKTRPVNMDSEGVRVDDLKDTQVIHVTASHHFPTGITMSAPRRLELLRWAGRESGRFIIEDDYDSEFRMSGRPVPTLFSMDRGGRVIYMNTFSRSLISTIRVSYMLLPPGLCRLLREKMGFYSCTVSNFEQYILEAFIRGGHFERHINRMRNESRKKRDIILRAVEKTGLGDKASIHEEGSGLHFLLSLDLRETEESFLERLRDNGVNLVPLRAYMIGDDEGDDIEGKDKKASKAADLTGGSKKGKRPCTFVVNYSSIPSERLEEAVRIMAKCAGESLLDK